MLSGREYVLAKSRFLGSAMLVMLMLAFISMHSRVMLCVVCGWFGVTSLSSLQPYWVMQLLSNMLQHSLSISFIDNLFSLTFPFCHAHTSPR